MGYLWSAWFEFNLSQNRHQTRDAKCNNGGRRTMNPKLLSRDQFREGVFARDQFQCVICKAKAVDAHHIIERKLWGNGGYYLDNGVSLCEEHHRQAEATVLSPKELRKAAGITQIVLPETLGQVLANGQRLKGPLFEDSSVQKLIAEHGLLSLFTHWMKYPRTSHLPWSQGSSKDDRVLSSLEGLQGRVIVSEKLDGENTTIYQDHIHARSLNSGNHPSRDWVKAFWATIKHDIPTGWRICGENVYAKHSIHYTGLESYFYGFSVWDDKNTCLSWDETLEYFAMLGITPAPVLFDGEFNEAQLRKLAQYLDPQRTEGYVVRSAIAFLYSSFSSRVAKYVRAGHVQTTQHWMHSALEPNQLR
jgi:hypothetical protein